MAILKDLLKQGKYITKINGVNYDITDFVDKHPGGEVIKGIANGNDGTAMFYSSHFNMPNIETIPYIKKITIHKDDIIECPLKFDYNDESFYNKLKLDIQDYFKYNNIDYTVPSFFSKICFLLNICLFGLFYYMSYIKGYIFFNILMGILSWNFAGILAHDHGAHRTTCGKFNIVGNAFMSLLNSICFPGAFETHFIHSHYAHHTMVHHRELDSDENMIYPLIRLHPEYKKLWFHRFQHLYWPFAFAIYLFSYIGQSFRSRDHNWWRKHNHLLRSTASIKFKLLLLSFSFFHFIVPVYFNRLYGVLMYLIFLFTYSTGGLFFATVSHYINDEDKLDNDWVQHTISRSSDYLVNSEFAHYISGGFNVHGLHHLFPTIHPSHLGRIYFLYEKRCKEYNYTLTNIKSWSELVNIYVTNLYILGNLEYKSD